MCRYILSVPPKETDRQHNLRMIFGNGLRPQIWTEFVERFNIKSVGEFYGATEGNANIGEYNNLSFLYQTLLPAHSNGNHPKDVKNGGDLVCEN